mmetsp:Transcript_19856/g.64605  ORF Transcript_19856/g.64605 Transcript_19856/m.64605 type:complete len:203 (+) Transcript_19856:914-1522(+)
MSGVSESFIAVHSVTSDVVRNASGMPTARMTTYCTADGIISGEAPSTLSRPVAHAACHASTKSPAPSASISPAPTVSRYRSSRSSLGGSAFVRERALRSTTPIHPNANVVRSDTVVAGPRAASSSTLEKLPTKAVSTPESTGPLSVDRAMGEAKRAMSPKLAASIGLCASAVSDVSATAAEARAVRDCCNALLPTRSPVPTR